VGCWLRWEGGVCCLQRGKGESVEVSITLLLALVESGGVGRANVCVCTETGADKRTSGFPFKNKEADKRKVKI